MAGFQSEAHNKWSSHFLILTPIHRVRTIFSYHPLTTARFLIDGGEDTADDRKLPDSCLFSLAHDVQSSFYCALEAFI